jgi:hypothetical protein
MVKQNENHPTKYCGVEYNEKIKNYIIYHSKHTTNKTENIQSIRENLLKKRLGLK